MKFDKRINKLVYSTNFKVIATSRNTKTNLLTYFKNHPSKIPIKDIYHNKYITLLIELENL